MCFEWNVEREKKVMVSGGREFHSLGAMTEKVIYSEMFGHIGWAIKTDESYDLVDREWDEKKTIV